MQKDPVLTKISTKKEATFALHTSEVAVKEISSGVYVLIKNRDGELNKLYSANGIVNLFNGTNREDNKKVYIQKWNKEDQSYGYCNFELGLSSNE